MNTENQNQTENTTNMINNQAKSKKNNKRAIKAANYIVLAAVLIGLVFVVRAYFNIGNDRYTNAAQVEAYINPINTRVSAYIKEIRFSEHQFVKKGDTLVVLDNREILTQVGQAEAGYLSALAAKNATKFQTM